MSIAVATLSAALSWSVETRADEGLDGEERYVASGVESIAVDSNGHWLVTGCADGNTRLWDLTSENPRTSAAFVLQGHTKPVSRLAISRDGRRLATGGTDETVRVWNLDATDPGAGSIALPGFQAAIWPNGPLAGAIAFSADDRKLLTAFNEIKTEVVNNRGWRARVWNLRATDPAAAGVLLEGEVAFDSGSLDSISANRRWVVTYSRDEEATTARVWDLNADDPVARVAKLTLKAPVRLKGAAIHPEVSLGGRWLFARTGSGRGDEYRLWDVQNPKPEGSMLLSLVYMAPARASGFSPDGRWLASGIDATPHDLRLWDLRRPDPATRCVALRGFGRTIRELAFSPSSQWLAAAGDGVPVWLWNMSGDGPADPVILRDSIADKLIFSQNSRRLVTVDSESGRLQVCDLSEATPGRVRVSVQIQGTPLRDVVVSPNGDWIAARGADKIVRLARAVIDE
jgi:WD40 repeat protein